MQFILRLEEEGAESPIKMSSDVAADNRVSESWLDFSDKSTAESARGRVKYKKAVPRAKPRSALNPGLFEQRTGEEVIYTGMVEAGTLPTGTTLQQGNSPDGTWASESTIPELNVWDTSLEPVDAAMTGYYS